ncbi:MAG: hypothetical protein IH985_07360 [Planctomycetes bacterium]|nr:hypothetical protein [Planctomycetota bacterium]
METAVAEFDVTMVNRVSGKQITERLVARDMEDARGKALRDGWLTGSIEPAPIAADEVAPPVTDEVGDGRMRVSEAEWVRFSRAIRVGVLWALIWFSVISFVIYLILYAILFSAVAT